jgi:hypothetical protein
LLSLTILENISQLWSSLHWKLFSTNHIHQYSSISRMPPHGKKY